MRVADFLAQKLYEAGVGDVFLVTGGGMMFLTDGLACHPNIRAIPCLHEQSASMAAISYAQSREGYGCCYVTSGCGGTNAVTGVLHAWQDHVPVIYVSGQCNRDEMMAISKSPVRQIGLQEADIVSIISSITKYAKTIMEIEDAVYIIEEAFYEAKNGNPGPVWLDIPLDIQEAEIDPANAKHFVPEDIKSELKTEDLTEVMDALKSAARPMILAGQGIRLSGAVNEFTDFIEKYGIPMVGTRLGWDIYPRNKYLHIGLADTRGTRAGNFSLQNADVVICLGTRLGLMTTGYSYDLFLREAKKVIVVDIDDNEHKKGTVRIDKFIHADIREFLCSIPKTELPDYSDWVHLCNQWKKMWPMVIEEHMNDGDGISKFAFIHTLNQHLQEDSIVTTDAGATTEIPMQALEFSTRQQRYLGSASQCEMGYSVPAAIGASIGTGKKEVCCIVGDGSLQMNIQELQTIVTQKLPIKIFVWDNGGYGTIRGHQKSIFKGRFVGVDPQSGTAFPNLEKLADAYGINYLEADRLEKLDHAMGEVLGSNEAVMIRVLCWKEEVNPVSKAQMRLADGSRISMPLEDMIPPVDRAEFTEQMIISPIVWWE